MTTRNLDALFAPKAIAFWAPAIAPDQGALSSRAIF